jgi:transcriptional regulator with XRE-family HTH domain
VLRDHDPAKEDPAAPASKEAQDEDFALIGRLQVARNRAGMTLEQVAGRMGTTRSAVSRLESTRYKPSLRSLLKYSQAIGCRLEVRLVPKAPAVDHYHDIFSPEETLMYPYYSFTITLLDLEPAIWRRFMLPTSATFLDLHKAIQAAGGWEDYHLFEFQNVPMLDAQRLAGLPDEEDPEDRIAHAKAVRLGDFFGDTPEISCVYNYDFGDNWRALVKMDEIQGVPFKFKRALLNGARAWPLEDMGGPMGYEDSVAAIGMTQEELKTDPGAVDRLDWMGCWHPDVLDLESLKRKFDR